MRNNLTLKINQYENGVINLNNEKVGGEGTHYILS